MDRRATWQCGTRPLRPQAEGGQDAETKSVQPPPPPRDDEDLSAICSTLLQEAGKKWKALLEDQTEIDGLWEYWTWMAEETGLALSCDSLTKDTATPLPYAPGTMDRGRGTDEMLIETGLGPTKTTARGAPFTRLLSKILSS